MKALTKTEVKEYLSANLKSWVFDGDYIKKDFKFKSFVEAFSFMTSVALEAEKIDHHPEWNNVYNRVTIKLNTHDAEGITQMDFDLALKIDKLSGTDFIRSKPL